MKHKHEHETRNEKYFIKKGGKLKMEENTQQLEIMQDNVQEDDGSLAFLKIPRDKNSRSFNCEETTQSKLVNTQFWVHDYIGDVPTKFSKQKGTKGQYLVLMSVERDARDSDMRKFFTGSKDIIYILEQIRERNAFPRQVMLRGSGNRYWFE